MAVMPSEFEKPVSLAASRMGTFGTLGAVASMVIVRTDEPAVLTFPAKSSEKSW